MYLWTACPRVHSHEAMRSETEPNQSADEVTANSQPANAGLDNLCSFISIIHMKIGIFGTDMSICLFEKVETTNEHDACYHVGVQHGDGDMNAVIVGANSVTYREVQQTLDERRAKRDAKRAARKERKNSFRNGKSKKSKVTDMPKEAAA